MSHTVVLVWVYGTCLLYWALSFIAETRETFGGITQLAAILHVPTTGSTQKHFIIHFFRDTSTSEDIVCWSNKAGYAAQIQFLKQKPQVLLFCSGFFLTALHAANVIVTVLWANYAACIVWLGYILFQQSVPLCDCMCKGLCLRVYVSNLLSDVIRIFAVEVGEDSRDWKIKQKERKTWLLSFCLFRGPVWL